MVAQDFVEQLFQSTVDKAGKPYVEHCKFVSKLAEDSATILGMSEDDQLIVSIAGMCHDVLEDTDTTYEQLIDLIGPCCFVDTEGNWHELGRVGWFASIENPKDDEVWDKEVNDYIESQLGNKNVKAFVLDCHI